MLQLTVLARRVLLLLAAFIVFSASAFSLSDTCTDSSGTKHSSYPCSRHDRTLYRCFPSMMISQSSSISDDDGKDRQLATSAVPPGRPTRKWFSFLFDDTLRLLNPKTMALYQVRRTKQFGSVFKTNIFFRPTVFVTSPDSLTALGKQEARRRDSMEAFFPPHHQTLFGPQSLLVQSGNRHGQLRRLIQPSLSPTAMNTLYQPIIDKAMDDFLKNLPRQTETALGEKKSREMYFPLVPHLRSFFISIALQLLLDNGAYNDDNKNATSSTETVPKGLAEDLTIWSKGLLAPPLTFIPWSTAAKAMRARKRICNTLTPLLEQERVKKEGPSTNSLLGRLVSAVDDETGDKLSNQDILDNVLTLIFAGSDTTASAATSLWMTLSLHPTLKDKLRQDPSKIPLVVQNVLETYPPAPFQMRLAKESIKVQGYEIPANWMVVYGFAGSLLANKNSSNEALDELLDETSSTTTTTTEQATPSSSLAFGTGPRMCPGRYLASLELTTLCQKLLDYEWELNMDQNLEQMYNPGLFPKDGLQIKC